MRDAFAAEASVWVRLEKHPFIARAYEVEKFGGLPYVITEYVRGKEGRGPDLRSWIGDASVGLPVAIELALQIAQGMQHAVRKVPGLVHRDLKPANILVNDRAQAMVTDFGLAAGAGLEGGTPAYMAPEQWRDEPPDVRTDIYAYGCILYELFTRHRLYAAVSENDWRHAHLELTQYAPRAHCPELPEELEGFVLSCLDKQRDRRPAGWDEVVETCARWFHRLTGQPAVLDFSAYALDVNELLTAGYSLSQLGGHREEQLELYDRALATGAAGDETTAVLLVNKGFTLGQLGRGEEEIRVYEEVVSRFGDASEAHIREQVAGALFSKANGLGRLGRGEEAVRVYEEVVSRFGDAIEAGIRQQVAKALVNKANGLGRLGRGEETIRVCEEVVSRFGDAPEAGIREQVARALFGKSMTLGGLGRREEEIRGYEEVVSRFGDAPECGIRDLVAIALTNKADTLVQLGHGEEAIVVFEEVVSRFGDAPEAGIREQVAKAQTARDTVLRAGESRGEAERATLLLAENLMRQGRFADAVGLLDDLLARLGTFSCPVDRTTAEWASELRRDALRHGGR
jgi:tetratricopeptide (TPR) repeat protein